jgi:hypothetical protein
MVWMSYVWDNTKVKGELVGRYWYIESPGLQVAPSRCMPHHIDHLEQCGPGVLQVSTPNMTS